MLKKNYKGRVEKRTLGKAREVCRFYSDIASKLGTRLQLDASIVEIECNHAIELDMGDYTSDFLCKKSDGSYMVRECVQRKYLMKPKTILELDASREYWHRHGVDDWGLCIEREGDTHD